MNSFYSISEPAFGFYSHLNSKFEAYAYPISTVKSVESLIDNLRLAHPKARHFCYAYRIGFSKPQYRCSDDGEPSGSAGRPILNQIFSAELTNILVVVVRYFGGTKLGIPGLILAYKTATKQALESAHKVDAIEYQTIKISLTYQLYYKYIELIKRHQYQIISEAHTSDGVTLEYLKPKSDKDILIDLQ